MYVYVGNDPVNSIDPWGLSPSLGSCLAKCTAEHYGLGGLIGRGVVGAGAFPISKRRLGLPVIGGSSKYTNLWSLTGLKLGGPIIGTKILGTKNVLRMIGRVNPWIGAGLLAYDAISIGLCVSNCMEEGPCKK